MRITVRVWAICGMIHWAVAAMGCNNDEPSPPVIAQSQPSGAVANEPTAPPAAPISESPVPAVESPTSVKPMEVQPAPDPAVPPAIAPVSNPEPSSNSPQDDPKVATFGGLTGPKSATWAWQPANRLSVIAEYIVPGRDGLNQGRVTVFRVGGSPEQNILRWKTTQFRGPNQTAVEPKLDQLESDGMAITLAEFTGEFKGTGAVNFSPDHTLLAAIIPDAPGGQIIIYFVGPTGTVEPNREAFMELIRNLKRVEAEK